MKMAKNERIRNILDEYCELERRYSTLTRIEALIAKHVPSDESALSVICEVRSTANLYLIEKRAELIECYNELLPNEGR